MKKLFFVFTILMCVFQSNAQNSLYGEVSADWRNSHLSIGLQSGESVDLGYFVSVGLEYNYSEQFAPTLILGMKLYNPNNSVYVQISELHSFPISIGYRRNIWQGINLDIQLHPKYPTIGVTWTLHPDTVELSTAFGCY